MLGVAAMLLADGCRCGEERGTKEARNETVDAVVEPRALEVEFTGCHATTRVPLTCELKDEMTELRFWVAGSRHLPTVAVDGVELRMLEPPEPIDDGHLVVLNVDRGASAVRIRSGPPAAPREWSVALTPSPPTPLLDAALSNVDKGALASDPDAAAATIEALRRVVEGADGVEKAEALVALQVVQYQLGDVEASLGTGTKAIDVALREGRISTAIRAAQVMGPVLEVVDPHARGRWALDIQRTYLPLIADARQVGLWNYLAGSLAKRSDRDLGLAARLLEESATRARRLGRDDDYTTSAARRVGILAAAGRIDAVDAQVSEMLEQTRARAIDGPCARANDLNNASWGLMLGAAHEDTWEDVDRLQNAAMSLFERWCSDRSDPLVVRGLVETRLNRFLAQVARGRVADARSAADAIERQRLDPAQRGWYELAYGRLHLLDGKSSAASTRLTSLLAQPATSQDPQLAWQATVALGRALLADGDRDGALEAFLAAEDLVDVVVAQFGPDQGREGVLAGLHAAASEAIAILLVEEKVDAALRVARKSRAREHRIWGRRAVLATASDLTKREWGKAMREYERLSSALEAAVDLSTTMSAVGLAESREKQDRVRREMSEVLARAEELLQEVETPTVSTSYGEPEPGEVWLVFHPLPSGWVEFVATRESVEARRLESSFARASAAGLADRVLPVLGTKPEYSEVKVLPMLEVASIDFHALPVAEGPLVQRVAVSYGTDARASQHPDSGPGEALVFVADGDVGDGLEAARREANAVRAGLMDNGWAVRSPKGAPSRAEFLGGLEGVDLLHYIGHSLAEDSTAWTSQLRLGGDAAVTIQDVIALPEVPKGVVLNACSSGRLVSAAIAGGMTVATAFVDSGSEFVIAATADVDDVLAAELGSSLYADVGRDVDGPQMLRRAQLHVREQGYSDWARFRVWVP